MRIEISRLVTSRCLSACAALVALICLGCDVEKIGAALDRHGTKLSGRNAAIGGVNFRSQAGKDRDSDWHITSCRLNSGPADISLGTGSGEPILTISKNGNQVKVVLRGPDGSVAFEEKQCTSFNLDLHPHAAGSPEMDGSTSLVCKSEQGTLHSSVRFQRCSR